ncbi:MAG: toluene tolerance protein [Pseudomonadales bacterium]|nr:ABC transporter substrate-binding protein [Pseudomonadales bacterium]NIX06900.1 toluene tolerance protein [Pseudomonadales bacterium]
MTMRMFYPFGPIPGLSICVAVLLLASLAPVRAMEPSQAATRTATEVVEYTSDEMLALIDASRPYAKEDPERFYGEVEALLAPVVDFKRFARSVMAVHYKSATPEQRERFADTFKWGLVRTYALALTEFRDGEVVVVPSERPPQSPRRESVKMEIRTNAGEVYPVVYSMALGKDGAWRMGNIIVNGVNIGLTYRSQFASAVQDQRYGGNLDKVIDAWAQLLANETPGADTADSDQPADEAASTEAGETGGAR